jgi:nuclear pore complex protein Nup62
VTTKVAVPVPSLLKGMTLEDICNRWSADLDERVRDFTNLAAEVKAWDSVLIQNGEEISKLYNGLSALDPVANTISESLDYVESQQKEMASVLDSYEAQLDELLAGRNSNSMILGSSGHQGSAMSEREKAYQLAETLNNQLDDLSTSLTSLINEVNSLSSSAGISSHSGDNRSEAQDPVSAIAAILNAHLSSLSWIEKTSDTLNEQVNELEGRVKQASGGRWQGISQNQQQMQRSGTPGRQMGRSTYGTPQRALMGSSANGSFGTPGRSTPTQSRLGQSSNLGRSGVFGLGARR